MMSYMTEMSARERMQERLQEAARERLARVGTVTPRRGRPVRVGWTITLVRRLVRLGEAW
jgi:hypothetical protein